MMEPSPDPSISPMLEVRSATTGDSVAVFEEEEIAGASVKELKQRLARKIGIPRFQLRLAREMDTEPLDDNQTFGLQNGLQVVKLVKLGFQPTDSQEDQDIMNACRGDDDMFLDSLERSLNQPRNPNFEDENKDTPLCAAAHFGNLKCVRLLLEAGANKDQGRTDNGETPLFAAARDAHLEIVRFLVESGANKDQGRTDGVTPLYLAAGFGAP